MSIQRSTHFIGEMRFNLTTKPCSQYKELPFPLSVAKRESASRMSKKLSHDLQGFIAALFPRQRGIQIGFLD